METETLRKSILKIMDSQIADIAAISKPLIDEGSHDKDIADWFSKISVYAAKSTECRERVRELDNDEDMLGELEYFCKLIRIFELKAVADMARLGYEIEVAIVAKQ